MITKTKMLREKRTQNVLFWMSNNNNNNNNNNNGNNNGNLQWYLHIVAIRPLKSGSN